MYSIQNVIYGVPLTGEIYDLIRKWEDEDDPRWVDGEDGPCGFESFYHGGSNMIPGFCGVKLGRIDECSDRVQVKDNQIHYHDYNEVKVIPLTPTKEQIVEAEEKIAKLDPEIKKLLPENGVYIVFSTS